MAVVILALLVAACGGDGGATEPTDTTAAGSSTTASLGGSGPDSEVEVSEATIILGGETYLFKGGSICDPNFLGAAFRAILIRVDENGDPVRLTDLPGNQVVTFGFPIEETEDPGAESLISIGGDVTWTASPTTFRDSRVDNVSIEGNRAHGTAIFDTIDGDGPTPGTFEVICAGE